MTNGRFRVEQEELLLMKSIDGCSTNASIRSVARAIGAAGGMALLAVLAGCSSQKEAYPAATTAAPAAAQAEVRQPVSEANLDAMPSDKLALYVFENHGCKNCHTMGKDGKLGFTAKGKEVGKNFEGCIRLLTAMNVIAQVPEEKRSNEEIEKAARFQDFGCTTSHQITPGKLGLTSYGAKLASLHMACTDVERVLSSRQEQGN